MSMHRRDSKPQSQQESGRVPNLDRVATGTGSFPSCAQVKERVELYLYCTFVACSRAKYIQNTVTDTRSKYNSCVPLPHSEDIDLKFGGQVASPTTYILGAVTSRTLRRLPYPLVHHTTHELDCVNKQHNLDLIVRELIQSTE